MIKVFISLYLICLASFIQAQGIFRLLKNQPQSFKFEVINNVVLVPVVINGMTLTFLLDTGVKETILFALANKNRYLHNQNELSFGGLCIGKYIEGILSPGHIVTVGAVALDTVHSVYVVQADDLDN